MRTGQPRKELRALARAHRLHAARRAAASMQCMDRMPPPPALQDASRALWLATLSLMTAFMQAQAPAHRLLIARRIARNFDTLRAQECFSADCRHRFARLGARWQRVAERLQGTPPRWRVLLERLGLA